MGTNERAISEILGTVLLISLVLLGSVTVIVFGASAISDAQERTTTAAATDYLEVVDSRLATLSASSDDPEVVFDPQDAAARDYHIQREGYLNVTINDNSDCSFQQQLSTISYEDSNGNRVGYEAGGVWRAGINGSALVTPPDVVFSKGMVNVNLVNVTGTFDQARNRVTLNVSETRNTTTDFQSRLLRHDCARPDTVNITVKSEFAAAWRDYLVDETGVPPVDSSDPGVRPVWVELNSTYLHPSANDETNKVVNLGGASYMDSGSQSIRGEKPPDIVVDKNANNTYAAYVGPVTNESLNIGSQISVEGANITGPPLDVSLVLDESGSMAYDEDGNGDTPSFPNDPDTCLADPGCTSRLELARQEAQNFVGYLNESRDRVSIQGFNASHDHYDPDQANFHRINGQYFSRDFDAVNDTIRDETHAFHGTSIDDGMGYSNSVFDFRGNESRQSVMVVLTDGRNTGCDDGDDDPYDCEPNRDTLRQAWIADNSSTTVFTIGFGSESEVNDQLLKDVANATGGAYYAARNSSALANAFKDISQRIQPKDAVANVPITSEVTNTSSGAHFAPEIPGDVDHIANNSEGYLNINDPTAPALFSHSFSIRDGDTFDLNVTEYDCKEGHYNTTGATVTVGGQTRSVVRCTEFATTNESYEGDIYVDGETVTQLGHTTYADWQTNITKSLNTDQYPSTRIDPDGTLNTTSNQALVVYDLPPRGSGTTQNTLALLVRVGLAESNEGSGIVTVRVSEASVD